MKDRIFNGVFRGMEVFIFVLDFRKTFMGTLYTVDIRIAFTGKCWIYLLQSPVNRLKENVIFLT